MTLTSRTISISIALLVAFSFRGVASDHDDFPKIGKTYAVSYLRDETDIARAGIPRIFTILKKGPNEWYYVKRADGIDHSLWINFAGVLTCDEAAESSTAEKPRDIRTPTSK